MRGRIVGGVVVGSPAHRLSAWAERREAVAHTSWRRFLLWRGLKALLVVSAFVWFFGSQWVAIVVCTALFGPDVNLWLVVATYVLMAWLFLRWMGIRG